MLDLASNKKCILLMTKKNDRFGTKFFILISSNDSTIILCNAKVGGQIQCEH